MIVAKNQIRAGVRTLSALAAVGLLAYCFLLVLLSAMTRLPCCPVLITRPGIGTALSAVPPGGMAPPFQAAPPELRTHEVVPERGR